MSGPYKGDPVFVKYTAAIWSYLVFLTTRCDYEKVREAFKPDPSVTMRIVAEPPPNTPAGTTCTVQITSHGPLTFADSQAVLLATMIGKHRVTAPTWDTEFNNVLANSIVEETKGHRCFAPLVCLAPNLYMMRDVGRTVASLTHALNGEGLQECLKTALQITIFGFEVGHPLVDHNANNFTYDTATGRAYAIDFDDAIWVPGSGRCVANSATLQTPEMTRAVCAAVQAIFLVAVLLRITCDGVTHKSHRNAYASIGQKFGHDAPRRASLSDVVALCAVFPAPFDALAPIAVPGQSNSFIVCTLTKVLAAFGVVRDGL